MKKTEEKKTRTHIINYPCENYPYYDKEFIKQNIHT